MGEQPVFPPQSSQPTGPETLFVIRYASKDLIFEQVLRGDDADNADKVFQVMNRAADVMGLEAGPEWDEVEFDPEPDYAEFEDYFDYLDYPKDEASIKEPELNAVPDPTADIPKMGPQPLVPRVGARVRVIADDCWAGCYGVIIREDKAKDFDWIVEFTDGETMPYDNYEIEVTLPRVGDTVDVARMDHADSVYAYGRLGEVISLSPNNEYGHDVLVEFDPPLDITPSVSTTRFWLNHSVLDNIAE